ncbi:hypothetical protein JQ558_06870 [Bradyrhizobium sp. AUGA SZCCT0160]|nr:hypothetical protein [Bradyrhizobium sp. AUGA SZCCT0160]
MRGRTKIVIAALIAVAGYVAFKDDIAKLWENLHVRIAEYPQPKKTVWLDQGISKEKLSWFYHADQGTRTFGMPFEWFMALEQPTIPWLVFTEADPLSDPAYLDRYGFIPDTIIPGKKALPIGIAQGGPMLDPSGAPWRNPRNKQDMTGVGLTCAACHTGRFTYKDTAVIIDGGPALTDLFKLKQGMGVALLYTRLIPTRFDRFAERILGPASAVADREILKYQIDQVLTQLKAVKNLEEAVASQSVLEGYGRLDALNRIGNQVFSIDLKKPENYAGSSAPVHYPRIWNTPWFDWVQYNGSIMQPMVRNAVPNEIQGKLEYKVRPLNGVWATPPYLHNGSVPNVYALLSPVDERPKKFYLGNREYDPVNLGYKYDKLTNGFEFDTSIRGNWNTGHEFADKPPKTKGVIGKKLAPDERKAIIEYLKTL